jgi:beta-glucosidase-like glycosyl hydrolase
MSVNSLENTYPFNRHTFDANSTYGVDPQVLADYYLVPFKKAIREAGARGIMCSYNAVMGKPTCLSPLMRNARKEWGFEGYVTSDSDSLHDAWASHHYVPNGIQASALALTEGQCDINSGDTYNDNLLTALGLKTDGLVQADVDRAVYNSLRQRFDLGLFDPPEAYHWPSIKDLGNGSSSDLSLTASQKALVLLRNDQSLLPLSPGKQIAVIGPHATAKEVLVQPYPARVSCPASTGGGYECLESPFEAIQRLNVGGNTTTSPGCDLFNYSEAGFAEALALAEAADVVVMGLGIETCGMNPAHNVNPLRPGRCFQEQFTTKYVFPDQYLELEAHDRTIIDLPPIQHGRWWPICCVPFEAVMVC